MFTMKLFSKIISNVSLKPLTVPAKKVGASAGRYITFFFFFFAMIQRKSSNGDMSLTASKDGIVFINYLH